MNAKEALEAPSTLEAMLPYRVMLEAALEFAGGTHLFEDIVEAVGEGRMHFWPAEKSCVVTEVVCYPRARAIHIFLAAGDLMEIKDMDERADRLRQLKVIARLRQLQVETERDTTIRSNL